MNIAKNQSEVLKFVAVEQGFCYEAFNKAGTRRYLIEKWGREWHINVYDTADTSIFPKSLDGFKAGTLAAAKMFAIDLKA